jgi:hypothetical protein
MSRTVAFMIWITYRYNSLTMKDTSVYNLARTVRKNLRATALCQEPDLRRMVGHANILDNLIAELVDLGYDWNDVPSEQTTTVTDRPFTPSGHVQWADQVTSDTKTERPRHSADFEPSGDSYDLEDSSDSDQSDNSNDSDDADDWDDSDNSSDSDESEESDLSDNSNAAFVGMVEEYGNRDPCYSKYILITTAQTCRTPSPDMSILVAVQEICNKFSGAGFQKCRREVDVTCANITRGSD